MDVEFQKSIRERKKELFKIIKEAQEELKKLRQDCKHPNTEECIYQWRIGSTVPTTICSDCGEVIKMHFLDEKDSDMWDLIN